MRNSVDCWSKIRVLHITDRS